MYSLPPGSTFTPSTLIQSSVVNGINNDLATDLNTPRPIVAGGTGASSAAGAAASLAVLPTAGGTMTGDINMGYHALTNPGGLLLTGYLNGLALSNNVSDAVNDIDIAIGSAATDSAVPTLMTLASGLTKRTDAAWAVGTGVGGWLDGVSMPNGTGHVFLIQRSDTLVVDVGFSASLTPTLPTNYDRKRRIGSILRESASIVAFTQFGDLFLRTSPATDRSALTAQSSVLLTLSVPVGIPVRPILQSTLGLSVAASWTNSIGTAAAGSANVAIQQLTISSGTAVDITTADFAVTNTSAQIYFSAVQNSGGSPSTNSLRTAGWYDARGRV